MATFPWRQIQPIDPERSYTALLGFVQVPWLALPKFLLYGPRVERQLRRTPGLVGYRTAGKALSREFVHLSAWENAEAIHAFVHTEPHLHAMHSLLGRFARTEFRYWTIQGSALPLRLEPELHRLDIASEKQHA